LSELENIGIKVKKSNMGKILFITNKQSFAMSKKIKKA